MKRNFCLLPVIAFLIVEYQVNGQVTTYRTRADSARSKTGDIRERLVQLALQNPSFEIADRKVAVTNYQFRKAQGDWLGAVALQLNLNELTVKRKSGGDLVVYPLYNVGVTLPLNFFIMHKNQVKVAQEEMYIAEAEKNEKFRQIRAQVLSKYEDYLMYKAQLELQSRLTQDAQLNFRQKEKDFQDNLITLEEFNKAQANWIDQESRRLILFRDFNVSKLEIEEMIGISIDELVGKK